MVHRACKARPTAARMEFLVSFWGPSGPTSSACRTLMPSQPFSLDPGVDELLVLNNFEACCIVGAPYSMTAL